MPQHKRGSIRFDDPALATITAKVPPALAERLQAEARANFSTVSGEIRRLLTEKFGCRS